MLTVLRLGGGIIALGLGACSVAVTVCFGLYFAQGNEGLIFGAIFGFLECVKILLPTIGRLLSENGARNYALQALAAYLILVVFSIGTHCGLYVTLKENTAGGAKAATSKYDDAKTARDDTQAQLKKLGAQRPVKTVDAAMDAKRIDPLFKRSKECKDVSLDDSRNFCREYFALKAERETAAEAERLQAKLDIDNADVRKLGVVEVFKKADPQVEMFMELTGWGEKSVRLTLAVVLSLLIEFGSSQFLKLITAIGRRKDVSEPSRQFGDTARAGAVERSPRSRKSEPEPLDNAGVEEWAREALTAKRNGYAACTTTRETYERSVRVAGGVPVNPNTFGRCMTKLGYRRKKRNGQMFYSGVVLVPHGLKIVG
jgi:hypothetical protein